MTEVERAKADGRWEAAYAGQAGIEVPADLAAALAAKPQAQAMFDILTSQNRYAVLYRIANAKRAETRARRITQFVDMLARGEAIHPQKRALGPTRTPRPLVGRVVGRGPGRGRRTGEHRQRRSISDHKQGAVGPGRERGPVPASIKR
ncbi:YdeI/OmpD-associated family protein [Nonomuraea rosea]